MRPLSMNGHSRPVTKVMFDFIGEFLFTCSLDGRICCWDVEDANLLRRYVPLVEKNKIEKAIWDIDVTYDSSKLIAASAVGVFIFDVESGDQLLHIPFDSVCKCIRWNKTPTLQDKFAVANDSFTSLVPASISIFKYHPNEAENNYKSVLRMQEKHTRCTCITWGPFDLTIVSGHDDGTIIIWDAKLGEKLQEIQAHTKTVTSFDTSDNNLYLLSSSLDTTAKLWTLNDFKEIQVYRTDRPLNSCSISPLFYSDKQIKRNHILVAGGQSASEVTTTKSREGKQEAILFHIIKAEMLGIISGHFSPINSLKFIPNGKGFATGAEEGNARLYKFDQSYFECNKFD